MSFKYNCLPFFVRGKKRSRETFEIDDDIEISVESTAAAASPTRVDVRLKRRRRRFSHNVVFDEATYDSIKQRLHDIRERLNCVRLDPSEARRIEVNSFEFNNNIMVFVGLNENGHVYVSFDHISGKRCHTVSLNEVQYSALENMITRSIIDGAINNLSSKCIE